MATYIWSALSLSGSSFGLGVQDAVAAAGTAIVLTPWGGGQDYELWTIDPDGHLISQLDDQLVIGLNASAPAGALVLCALDSGDATQQWTQGANGTMVNQSTGSVMSVSGGNLVAGAGILPADAPTGVVPDGQEWQCPSYTPQPVSNVPQWCLIQSNLSTSDMSYVLDLQDGNTWSGVPVVLEEQTAGSSSQKWMFTPDGRLLSHAGEQLVMGLGPKLANGATTVIAEVQPLPAYPGDYWRLDADGTLVSLASWYIVTVPDDQTANGTPLITAQTQTEGAGQLFSVVPMNPLASVLAAGPQPYPSFQGDPDEASAYAFINAYMNASTDPVYYQGDLRATYQNTSLTADYAIFITAIESKITCPDTIPIAAWTAVVNQLTAELMYVPAIQGLATNYDSYQSLLRSVQTVDIDLLITDAGLETGGTTSVGGSILALFSGILYTVLEAVPGAGEAINGCAVLGNLIQTAINVAVATPTSSGGISPDPFQVEVSELRSQLATQFLAVAQSLGTISTTILGDWGKLAATYDLIISDGPDTLGWSETISADLVAASAPGFKTSIMQMLLPYKYQIFMQVQDDDTPFAGVSALVQSIEDNGDGTYNHYWIGDRENWQTYPADEAIADAFGTGNSPGWSFFHSAGGWTFAQARTMVDDQGTLNVTVYNQTCNPLYMEVTMQEGTAHGDTKKVIAPYFSDSVLGSYYSGLEMLVNIYDLAISSDTPVATFTGHQDFWIVAATQPWVDTKSQNSGYVLSTELCNPGWYLEGCTGTIQMTISQSPVTT